MRSTTISPNRWPAYCGAGPFASDYTAIADCSRTQAAFQMLSTGGSGTARSRAAASFYR